MAATRDMVCRKTQSTEVAGKAWQGKDGLTLMSPDDICRFQKNQQDVVGEWLGKHTGVAAEN